MNMSAPLHSLLSHRGLVASAVTLACSLAVMPSQAQPVSASSLYYRMGGGSPFGGAANKGSTPLSLSAGVRTNYSCGKFDVGVSWSNVMDGFQDLGSTVSNAVQAGIAALPLYMLQRAQPGLYQLFQNFSQKADLMVANALKNCEEMEAMIANGKDPYAEWVSMAKGDAWKLKASSSGDVVQAKYDINKNEEAQKVGIDWVFGAKAGGIGTAPIRPVRDLAVAGYNVTVNRAANASANANYGSSSLSSSRLVQAFKTPESLATWSTDVLGDQKIYLCTQDSSCPDPTVTSTAAGLGPKYESELDSVLPTLRTAAASSSSNYSDLVAISAPGMSVSPQLMDSIRKLPADTRAVAVNRLSQELAMHRVIDKALIARNALISGLSVPQATAASEATKGVQEKIDRLTQYINDLMFEFRIRKEMTGDTALAIMSNQFAASSASTAVPQGVRKELNPLVDGKVTP